MGSPRYLTPDEILDIVKVIPAVSASIIEVAEKARREIQSRLADQLRTLRIVPDGIPQLKEDIISHFNESVAEPGTATGISSGESLGAPIMQMTLNTIHSAGSEKSMSTGIDGMKEIAGATHNMKFESLIIHLKNIHLSYEEAYTLKSELVGISVKDLAKSSACYHYNSSGSPMIEWWYPLFLKTMNVEIPTSPHYIRVELNRAKLYSAKITPAAIARAMMDSLSSSIICVASPVTITNERGLSTCYLDIYPREDRLKRYLEEQNNLKKPILITPENAASIFLQYVVEPSLDKVIVKGLKGIKLLSPVTIPTWAAIKWEERYIEFDRVVGSDGIPIVVERPWTGKWKLHIDRIKLLNTGIPIRKVTALLEVLGFEILHTPLDPDIQDCYDIREDPNGDTKASCYIINFPSYKDKRELDLFDEPETFTALEKLRKIDATTVAGLKRKEWDYLKPSEYLVAYYTDVKKAIDDAKSNLENMRRSQTALEEATKTLERRKLRFDSFLRCYTYVYLDGNGTDLKKVLANPLVDPRRTMSNNWHEMNACFGIIAGGTTLLNAYQTLISSSRSYVNPRHLSLLTAVQTSLGCLLPVTATGASRQNAGAFSKASFSKALDAFKDAALFGKKESTHPTSTSIFLGKRIEIGTGSFGLVPNKPALEAAEKRYSESIAGKQQAASKVSMDEIAVVTEDIQFAFVENEGIDPEDYISNRGYAAGVIQAAAQSEGDFTVVSPVAPEELTLCNKGPVPIGPMAPTQIQIPMSLFFASIFEKYGGSSTPRNNTQVAVSTSAPPPAPLPIGNDWNSLADLSSFLDM